MIYYCFYFSKDYFPTCIALFFFLIECVKIIGFTFVDQFRKNVSQLLYLAMNLTQLRVTSLCYFYLKRLLMSNS